MNENEKGKPDQEQPKVETPIIFGDLFFKPQGEKKLTADEKVEICKANLLALVNFNKGEEVTFTDLKGRASTCKKGMIQALPVGNDFENGKLVGISYAAGADSSTPTFTATDGKNYLVHNFTGWWAPESGTHFTDKKAVRQYSIFTGK